MPSVSLRQVSMYPFLDVTEPEGYGSELAVDVARNTIGVYKTALRALLIAELELLREIKPELDAIKASTPEPKDRSARNRRTRAIQLLDRITVLEGKVGG